MAGRKEKQMKAFIKSRFEVLAEWISAALGRPLAFMLALGVVLVWAVSGPLFGYSDTWQLVINTGTTISTFLMVFLLQNTGNRTIAELQDHLHRLERRNSEILSLLRESQTKVRRVA
jgi:low affinity Fe/Cu permease